MMSNFLAGYYLSVRNVVLVTIFLVAGWVSTGVAKEGPILVEDDVPIENRSKAATPRLKYEAGEQNGSFSESSRFQDF